MSPYDLLPHGTVIVFEHVPTQQIDHTGRCVMLAHHSRLELLLLLPLYLFIWATRTKPHIEKYILDMII